MLKQFYSSILSMTAFLFSVIVLCALSFNWSNFKKIYDIDEINIYGTNFFDQSLATLPLANSEISFVKLVRKPISFQPCLRSQWERNISLVLTIFLLVKVDFSRKGL